MEEEEEKGYTIGISVLVTFGDETSAKEAFEELARRLAGRPYDVWDFWPGLAQDEEPWELMCSPEDLVFDERGLPLVAAGSELEREPSK